MPGDLPLEPYVRTQHKNALVALAASPWAPLVAIGGQKQIILYNTDTLQPAGILPFPEGFPAIIRFSRNGKLLLTGGGLGGKSGKVVLWDIATGERIATIGNEFDQVLAADLSADQQFVALGGPTKLVKIYATKDGKLVHSIKKHTDWVTAIAYSPDGKYLASADRNGGIQIWEGSSGKEYNALPGHKVMVTSLAFMTGVVASGSEDGTVKLWDAKEGKESKSWNAHSGGVAWVDFVPDGRIVSCGRDKIAKVWDQTGKELAKIAEPFGDIALRAALSNDRIVAGDWTGEIRVCSLDGKRVGELTANPPPIAERIELAAKRIADADAAVAPLRAQCEVAEAKWKAEKTAAEEKRTDAPAELTKKIEEQKGALAKLREARAAKPADSPEFAAADKSVQAKKAEIAKMEADLAAAPKEPSGPPAAKPTPAAEEYAKTHKALDDAVALADAAKNELAYWLRADAFMTVHKMKAAYADKQARHDELVTLVKEALVPAEQAAAKLAAVEKAAADAPRVLQERETLFAQAAQNADALNKTIGPAEAALTQKEGESKSITEQAAKATAALADARKQLEKQKEEVTKLREARAMKAAGTPEYAEADAKVQAKKKEIADTENVVVAAQTKVGEIQPQADALRAEIAKAREALEKSRAEAKSASEKAVAAEKALVDARKATETARVELEKLRKEVPEITRAATEAKTKAEAELASLVKDLENAKAELKRVQTEFDAKWKRLSPVVAAAQSA
jgi:hypothetical protein